MKIKFGEDKNPVEVKVGQVWKNRMGATYIVGRAEGEYADKLLNVDKEAIVPSGFYTNKDIDDSWTKIADSFTISWKD